MAEIQLRGSLESLRVALDVPETEADLACGLCRCPKSGRRDEPNVRDIWCRRAICLCHAVVQVTWVG